MPTAASPASAAGAEPSFDEVLAARASRTAVVRRIVEELTPEEFARNPAAGYPTRTTFPVGVCLGIVVGEEWAHHQYAVRDLAVLEAPT